MVSLVGHGGLVAFAGWCLGLAAARVLGLRAGGFGPGLWRRGFAWALRWFAWRVLGGLAWFAWALPCVLAWFGLFGVWPFVLLALCRPLAVRLLWWGALGRCVA